MKDILLDINGLTKAYPGVVANKNVSFQIRPGEVHALLGENGAGKSTLVKMIYGLVKPDSGSMTFQNQQFAPTSTNAARGTGVAVVMVLPLPTMPAGGENDWTYAMMQPANRMNPKGYDMLVLRAMMPTFAVLSQ